jgi:hypothetical protein
VLGGGGGWPPDEEPPEEDPPEPLMPPEEVGEPPEEDDEDEDDEPPLADPSSPFDGFGGGPPLSVEPLLHAAARPTLRTNADAAKVTRFTVRYLRLGRVGTPARRSRW